jgi:hypothetical protein
LHSLNLRNSRPFGTSQPGWLAQREESTMATTKTKSKKANGKTAKPRQKKSARIAAMLRRKNGCTREEVLAETGWAAVSMQQQARAAGVTLKIG